MTTEQDGTEPDYRFSLANERTFLAWIRTALAVLAGGILLHQFPTDLQPRVLVSALGAGLSLVSALLAGGAYLRWRGNERAMRHAGPLPRSWLIPLLSPVVAVLSAAAAFMLLRS